MGSYPSVSNILIAFKKAFFIIRVDHTAPEGRRILHNLSGQPEFLHHGRRISEHTGFHVSYKYVVICTRRKGLVQMLLIIPEAAGLFPVLSFFQKFFLGPSYAVIPFLKIHFLINLPDDIEYRIPVGRIYFHKPYAEGYFIE